MTPRFFRYTKLPILLDILKEKRLTLSDPNNWDDKNDAYFLELYKNGLGLKTVLALCFTQEGEKYHIWKVFAGDTSGVCIEFHKDLLLGYFDGMEFGNVDYKTKDDLNKLDISDFKQLPFMKRQGFDQEKEFRILYENRDGAESSKSVRIGLNCIKKVIFNPWISTSVFNSVKALISKIDGCEAISVERTDLINSEKWKKTGRKIAGLPDEVNDAQ